jgi:transcriptional regulator with XRE-family HTH domain
MQLADYLAAQGLSLNEFARRVGAKNARTIQRYTKHGRTPSGRMMAEIARVTNGAVQPNDFFPVAQAN